HGDLPDDAESESRTALLPRVGSVGLGELFEDPRFELGWNTAAVIANRDARDIASLLGRRHDLSSLRRKLDRVRQKVGDHLRQPIWISRHIACLGGGIETYPHVEAIRVGAISLDHLLDKRTCVDPLEIENDLSRLDLFDIENVVDQTNEPLAVTVRD